MEYPRQPVVKQAASTFLYGAAPRKPMGPFRGSIPVKTGSIPVKTGSVPVNDEKRPRDDGDASCFSLMPTCLFQQYFTTLSGGSDDIDS